MKEVQVMGGLSRETFATVIIFFAIVYIFLRLYLVFLLSTQLRADARSLVHIRCTVGREKIMARQAEFASKRAESVMLMLPAILCFLGGVVLYLLH